MHFSYSIYALLISSMWNDLNLTSYVDTMDILDMPFLLESEIEKVLND